MMSRLGTKAGVQLVLTSLTHPQYHQRPGLQGGLIGLGYGYRYGGTQVRRYLLFATTYLLASMLCRIRRKFGLLLFLMASARL